jgi:chromosome segregation ATPase
MEAKRGVSALGKKVRLMKRPQDASSTFQKARGGRTTPASVASIRLDMSDLDLGPATSSDDASHLETQRKVLMAKLAQLSQDYAAEARKRRRLEEEVARARGRASSVFEQTAEGAELRDRLTFVQQRLDSARTRYRDNLEVLAGLRAQLDRLRRARLDATPRAHEIARLSESDRGALAACQRDLARAKRTAAPGDDLLAETDHYHVMIQRILDGLKLNSLPELFSEAERLERENREMFAFISENEETRQALVGEIDMLERQYKELSAAREESEAQQRRRLEQLTVEIARMQQQLSEIQTQKKNDEAEFATMYAVVESLFNALQCRWDGAPDGKTTVTPGNLLFALKQIEAAAADVVSSVGKVQRDE